MTLDGNIKAVIEGLIFASGEDGLSLKELESVLEIPKPEIESLIHELRVDLKEQGRGIQIVRVAQTFQMTTLPEHASFFEKMVQVPQRSHLSRPSLETLAIIAYRQPITRMEIEEIRGVKCERSIGYLQRKGLVRETGRASSLGRPILYGTTQEFLDAFGINQLEDLPSLEDLFNWQEWEEEQLHLFQRLGMEPVHK